MIDTERFFDSATLLSLIACLSAGLAAGMPLRLVFLKKDPRIRFRIPLFFVLLSISIGCSAAAFILLYRLGDFFPHFYLYCICGLSAGVLSSLFPRSAGLSLLAAAAALVFLSYAVTARRHPLEPDVPAAWLYVQDSKPGRAAVVFKDVSGSMARQLDSGSVSVEAEILLVRGPLGALTGRRYYRFITFGDVPAKRSDIVTGFLGLLGFDLSSTSTDPLPLRYLDYYTLSFDPSLKIHAFSR